MATVEIVIGIIIVAILISRDRKSKKKLQDKTEQEAVELEQQRQQREEEEERERQVNKRKEYEIVRQRKENEITEQTKAIINTHVVVLYRKKLQKSRRDDYGTLFDNEWREEKNYFFKTAITPKLKELYGPVEGGTLTAHLSDELIEQAIEAYSPTYSAEDVDINSLTPTDFETHCAALLNKAGWSTTMTAGSGDQGIDIIGEINGLKAVFQIKKSATPVGNKAVQEALAGKSYAAADIAFVV